MNVTTDVLIIGGGATAYRAAVEAREMGVEVTLVNKASGDTSGGTGYHRYAYRSGYKAAIANTVPQSRPADHIRDVLAGAHGMADEKLVELVAYEAPERFRELVCWGVPFLRDRSGYIRSKGCFGGKPSTVLTRQAGSLVRILAERARKAGVKIVERSMAVDLFVEDGVCLGAIMADSGGDFFTVAASSTVVATGGAGRLFQHSLNPPENTGDGYALGLRGGAVFSNMEFMQMGLGVLGAKADLFISPVVLALRPRITNGNGEEFLHKYLPPDLSVGRCIAEASTHFPFSCEVDGKWLTLAIYREVLAGNGSPQGGVYVDFRDVSGSKSDDQARMFEWLKLHGHDIEREPLEITVFHHAMNGGYTIDDEAQTTIQGLFAAGEVAAGPHGADRPGGHMLAVTQVFGAKAGYHAALRALAANGPTPPRESYVAQHMERWAEVRNQRGNRNANEVIGRIQQLLWENALVARNATGLRTCYTKLNEMSRENSRGSNEVATDFFKPFELTNQLIAAKLVIRAALMRTESRGSHYREDFPARNEGQNQPMVYSISDLGA